MDDEVVPEMPTFALTPNASKPADTLAVAEWPHVSDRAVVSVRVTPVVNVIFSAPDDELIWIHLPDPRPTLSQPGLGVGGGVGPGGAGVGSGGQP